MDIVTHIYLTEALQAKIGSLRGSIENADRLSKSEMQSEEGRTYFREHAKHLKRSIMELQAHIHATRPSEPA